MGLWYRVVVEAAVLDVRDVFIEMLLDTERLRCDSLQIPLQIAKHLDASLQPVHAPILLDSDGRPALLKAREYVQLVWSKIVEVVKGFILKSENLPPLLPVAEDHPPPLLDTYDRQLPLQEVAQVEVYGIVRIPSIPVDQHLEEQQSGRRRLDLLIIAHSQIDLHEVASLAAQDLGEELPVFLSVSEWVISVRFKLAAQWCTLR